MVKTNNDQVGRLKLRRAINHKIGWAWIGPQWAAKMLQIGTPMPTDNDAVALAAAGQILRGYLFTLACDPSRPFDQRWTFAVAPAGRPPSETKALLFCDAETASLAISSCLYAFLNAAEKESKDESQKEAQAPQSPKAPDVGGADRAGPPAPATGDSPDA